MKESTEQLIEEIGQAALQYGMDYIGWNSSVAPHRAGSSPALGTIDFKHLEHPMTRVLEWILEKFDHFLTTPLPYPFFILTLGVKFKDKL